MAAAAYAAVVSLLNTMDQFQSHPRLSASFDKYQNKILRSKVDFFLAFVENYSDSGINGVVEDLVRRIAVAAQEAEDVIEVEAANLIRGGSTEKRSPSFLVHLRKILQDMDCIKEKVVDVKEETGSANLMAPPPPPSSPPPPLTSTSKTTTLVGFDGYAERLLDELTGNHSSRRIIPIVGMGGLGKTTLARNAYQNPLTVYHFDVRVWVTVSQEFSVRDILLRALSFPGGGCGSTTTTEYEVGEELCKTLYGRRYLVVLDDVWSVEAWEMTQFFFPENNNRSRIVVTTRQQQLVDYFASSALALDFLDDSNSWELLCDMVEGCPSELEEVGKKIVKKCRGLPLAITVIGGLLRKSQRTQECWEKIAKDKSMILQDSGEANEIFNILYLSYKHLPVCLKSCFLYLGLFPEDHRINVSHLTKFWIAEGFIKLKTNQSLEEVGESYVKELLDRNLIFGADRRANKEFKTCYLHDLVREVCIMIAESEKFCRDQIDVDGNLWSIVDERMVSFYRPRSVTSRRLSVMRPPLFNGRGGEAAPLQSRLSRVMILRSTHDFNNTFRQVNNLRFLLRSYSSSGWLYNYDFLPSSMLQLWCLQSIYIERTVLVMVPSDIWKMPQLRHIEVSAMYLPDPPTSDDAIVLHSLQTLKRVRNLNLREEVCRGIPNVKDLGIDYLPQKEGGSLHSNLQNLGCFNKLELLQISCYGNRLIWNLKLPSSLKELSLTVRSLEPSDTAMMASLPRLCILVLQVTEWEGLEWNCVEEEFVCLKKISITGYPDLTNWIAESSSFPVLETLCLSNLSKLEEIPSSFGDIPTLEVMEIRNCSESATVSAIKILEEQESAGNQGLQLKLVFPLKNEAEIWREKIQLLGCTLHNFHIN